jgi:leader peptidase (prepilin peptidase)/N-methyltransferase
MLIPTTSIYILAGVLGAMFGSFLNVCVYRLPREQSVVRPRSSCPACGHLVRAWDNLPVLSWVILGGKCRDCGARISAQYPLIELASAALALAALHKTGLSWNWAGQFMFLWLLLGIAATDVQHYLIPDHFSLGGLIAGLGLSFIPGGVEPAGAVIGALTGGGALYLVAVAGKVAFGKDAMGGGDVKMLAMIGAFTGWQGVLFTVFAGSLAGSLIFGFINYVLHKDKLVPFGVFLSLGAGLYVFTGDKLISWYLSLFSF